jgi:CelD/BcsL family acetyltransferase involved in cellulose biosynthesis
VEQLAAAWRELCKECPRDEPFFRPEWIAAYLRAFEPQTPVLLATAHSDEQLRAVLPLIEKNGFFCGIPARILRGAGNEHSGRFDLVRCAGVDGDLAVRLIWSVLKDRTDWDLIELPYVPEGGAAEQLLRLASDDGFLTGQYESYRSPYIPLANGDRADLIPRRSDFRHNLRRRNRRAREKWDVQLRRVQTADSIELERFYALESSGWKGNARTAIACSEPARRFYDEIARVGSQFGYFSLYLLNFDDTVVGGHFGLSYQGHYYAAKAGYDERYAFYSPGHLIVEAVLRDLLAQGFSEFDFLGPWMDWKERWAREGRTHSFCYVFRPGLLGHTLFSMKLRVLTALRRVVRRSRQAGAASESRGPNQRNGNSKPGNCLDSFVSRLASVGRAALETTSIPSLPAE